MYRFDPAYLRFLPRLWNISLIAISAGTQPTALFSLCRFNCFSHAWWSSQLIFVAVSVSSINCSLFSWLPFCLSNCAEFISNKATNLMLWTTDFPQYIWNFPLNSCGLDIHFWSFQNSLIQNLFCFQNDIAAIVDTSCTKSETVRKWNVANEWKRFR